MSRKQLAITQIGILQDELGRTLKAVKRQPRAKASQILEEMSAFHAGLAPGIASGSL